jgi:hypothetical protein
MTYSQQRLARPTWPRVTDGVEPRPTERRRSPTPERRRRQATIVAAAVLQAVIVLGLIEIGLDVQATGHPNDPFAPTPSFMAAPPTPLPAGAGLDRTSMTAV